MTSERIDLEKLLENAFWLAPLARSLTRDSHAAEDALQDTWVTAVEKPPQSAAASRSWLETVLRHRIYGKHRESTRRTRREGRVARSEQAPSDEDLVERLELQGLVADVVLALSSPYRETIVLRFYGDLTPNEIATRQGVSVHTVHTRLRRGLATLREKLDAKFGDRRAWFSALAAIGATLGGGESAGAASTTSAVTIGTGVIMSMKSLSAVALLVIVGLLVLWIDSGEPESGSAEPGEGRAPQASTNPPASETSATEGPGQAVAMNEAIPAPPSDPSAPMGETFLLRGIIRSGVSPRETGVPLAGVAVRLYLPHRTTFEEHLADPNAIPLRWNEWGTVDLRLGVRVKGPSDQRASADDPIQVYDASNPFGSPISETVTLDDGSFEIPCPVDGCVLTATHPDYSPGSEIVYSSEVEIDLTLWKARSFTGVVVDHDGNPILEPIDLLFAGNGAKPVRSRTEESRFSVSVAATWVQVESLTPGFSVMHRTSHRGDKSKVVHHDLSFPIDEPSPLTIVASRVPVLVVRGEDGEPVRDFQLVLRETTGDFIRGRGRFLTRDGAMTFGGPNRGRVMSLRGNSTAADLSVWADGFEPTQVTIERFPWEGVLEVVLSSGEAPSLRGEVWDQRGAAVGATVTLAAFRDISWSEDESAVISATRTDRYGRFELTAPTGRFLLQIRYEERVTLRIVSLPCEAPVKIDFDNAGRVVATIRDSNGERVPNHVLALQAKNGRQAIGYTDDQGVFRFEQLPPGEYQIMTPHVSTTSSFAGEVISEVTIEGSEEVETELVIRAVGDPIYPRIFTTPASTFEGWTIRNSGYSTDREKIAIERDGSAALDMQIGVKTFEIEDSEGNRWDFEVPEIVPRPFEIEVPLRGLVYRGVLLEGDRPRPGVRLSASPASSPKSRWKSSAVTDKDGQFELLCDRATPHSFTFNEDEETFTWNNSRTRTAGVTFTADRPPSEAGTAIEIDLALALAPKQTVTLAGRVLRTGTTEPEGVSKAKLILESIYPSPSGVLRKSVWGASDETGVYSITFGEAPRYRANIGGWGEPTATEEWEASETPEDGAKDFFLPPRE